MCQGMVSGPPIPGRQGNGSQTRYCLPRRLTLPAGEYRLLVGWYDWQTGDRSQLSGNEAGDALTLVDLSVSQ
jgi:hypothetical protein